MEQRNIAATAAAGLRGIACIAAFAMSAAAIGATKIDEGFATKMSRDGRFLTPLDRVEAGEVGEPIHYWIQWKNHPVGHSELRCVVSDDEDGQVLYDESGTYEDSKPEGYSSCGFEFADEGNYTFALYLDGEKAGEQSVSIRQPSFWKELWGDYRHKSVYRQFKSALGVLALVIVAVAWIRKWRKGGVEPVADGLTPPASPGAGRAGIAIGSRMPASPTQAMSSSAPTKTDEAEELRRCGLQFQALIAQPDKAKAVELGRRYLGMLLKARNDTHALGVFKECLAADANFRPERAEDVLPLAKAARAAGDAHAAVSSVRGFDKIHPGHALIPEVYMFSAKLMAEDLANREMARKILEHLLQKYPGHFVAQEAKKYLQSMPQPA